MQSNNILKKYAKYKDSGIAWIGEIPEDWNIISFSSGIVRMSTGLNPRDHFQLSKDNEYYYVTIRNFKDGHLFLDENCDRISPDAWKIIQDRSQLKKGDILFASISKDGQAYLLTEEPKNWNINESVFCIRANSNYFIPKYLYYHITDSEYYNDLRLDSTGTTFQSIKQNKLRKSNLCLPPLLLQREIADYLDKKCGAIDKVIETEKEVIEKLKEYKQSIITEAVTKGLDKSAPMKDSGITWIGQIPQHWGIVQLKVLFKFIGGYAFKSDDYVEETMNQIIRIGNIRNNKLILNEKQVYITDETAASAINMLIKKNDILFSMTGTKGKRDYFYTVLVQDEHLKNKKLYLNQRVGCFRKKIDIDERYFNYLLKENKILDSIFIYETGTANQGNLGIETIINTKLHYPSITEQKIISNYLDNKCTKIDKAIADKEQVIEKMTEYKKSLIYECVTGKRKVVK